MTLEKYVETQDPNDDFSMVPNEAEYQEEQEIKKIRKKTELTLNLRGAGWGLFYGLAGGLSDVNSYGISLMLSAYIGLQIFEEVKFLRQLRTHPNFLPKSQELKEYTKYDIKRTSLANLCFLASFLATYYATQNL